MPPKMTAKYRFALGCARNAIAAGKPLDRHVLIATQEDLYASLKSLGFMWDSDQKEWIELSTESADDPTDDDIEREERMFEAMTPEQKAEYITRTYVETVDRLVEDGEYRRVTLLLGIMAIVAKKIKQDLGKS